MFTFNQTIELTERELYTLQLIKRGFDGKHFRGDEFMDWEISNSKLIKGDLIRVDGLISLTEKGAEVLEEYEHFLEIEEIRKSLEK